MKIDAERAELDILRGASKSLRYTKYVTIAAYHTPNEANELRAFLEGLNFKVIGEKGLVYVRRELSGC